MKTEPEHALEPKAPNEYGGSNINYVAMLIGSQSLSNSLSRVAKSPSRHGGDGCTIPSLDRVMYLLKIL